MGTQTTVKRATRVLLWAVFVLSTLMVVAMFVLGTVLCGTSEALSRVRSLDEAQLEQLHETMRVLDHEFASSGVRLTGNAIPEKLAFLRANGVVLEGEMTRINVAGCVDDFVILRFHGVASGPRKISLIPGEANPVEVLWSEAENSEE